MSDHYTIEITIRGPEREGKYGSTRDQLANLEVPTDAANAWQVYADALGALTRPIWTVEVPK